MSNSMNLSNSMKSHTIKRCRAISAAAAVAVLLVAGQAQARIARFASLTANQPAPPAVAAPAPIPPAVVEPSCSAPAPKCCPQPCIKYVNRGCLKVCCGCEAPVKTTITVVNPCTCCPVEIPVCLPACCKGCPEITSRCGLLCRGVVHYDWCCGFSVTVRFDRCGDAVVIYRGV